MKLSWFRSGSLAALIGASAAMVPTQQADALFLVACGHEWDMTDGQIAATVFASVIFPPYGLYLDNNGAQMTVQQKFESQIRQDLPFLRQQQVDLFVTWAVDYHQQGQQSFTQQRQQQQQQQAQISQMQQQSQRGGQVQRPAQRQATQEPKIALPTQLQVQSNEFGEPEVHVVLPKPMVEQAMQAAHYPQNQIRQAVQVLCRQQS